MRGSLLEYGGVLLLGGALQAAATAAETLPRHLTGTWGTGASLYEGTGPQNDLYLQADGHGVLAGSTSAPVRVDGKDDGKPAPRGIIGFPVRAVWEGDVLTVRPFFHDPVQAAKAARLVIPCRYSVEEGTLACAGLGGVAIIMRQRSAEIPDDVERMIDAAR